jgi:hypothetical protein
MTLPWSGWFTNHSKSFILFSYVICAFTYYIVELVFVLSYIRSHVWWSIEYSGTRCDHYYLISRKLTSHVWGSIECSGTRCGDYYLISQRLTTLIRWKILNSAVDVVSEALSMHMVPLAIWTIVIPAWVIVLLGIRNAPLSWTGTMGPSLPDSTIAPCVDCLLCYRSIRRPMSILQDSPKI